MEKAPQKQKISTYKKMAWLVFPQCVCSVKVIIKSPITDNEVPTRRAHQLLQLPSLPNIIIM